MSIRFPNFNNNLNPARDDEDEVDYAELSIFGGVVPSQDGVFDPENAEIDPEKLEKNLGEKPKKRDAAPEDLVKAMGEGGGSLAGITPERQPKYTSFKPQEEEEPPKEEEPQGLFDDVTDIDARQERERQAFADELAARKAEEIQRTEARAGLGGMGLSGATSELVGDVARQAERAGDIAMSDLERRQQQETFDELRRQASIWAFEEEFGVDLDEDKTYGVPDETEDSDQTITPEQSAEMAEQMNKEAKDARRSDQDKMSRRIGKDVNTVGGPDSPFDLYSWFNEDMGTYEDDSGFTWRIYKRPNGSYFRVTA